MSNSKDAVRKILDLVKADKRTSLTAPEGKLVCDAYGIPVPKEGVAKSASEAAKIAADMGFPVVMKIVSPDILHKTEAGGVVVGVKTAADAEKNYAAILANARKYKSDAKIEGIQIQQMLLGGQEVIVGAVTDGSFGKPGDALKVTLNNVDVATVDALLLRAPQLSGRLNASATIAGSKAAPDVSAQFAVTQGGFRQFKYDSFGGSVKYAGPGVTVDAKLQQNPSTWIQAKGYVPTAAFSATNPAHEHRAATAKENAFDLHVDSSPIDLGIVQGFTTELTGVKGTLQAKIDVTGAADDPHPLGKVTVQNAAFTVEPTGVVYTDLDGEIDLQDQGVHIDQIRVLDNQKKPLTITGDLALHERQVGAVSIAMKADDFKVIDNKLGNLRINSDLRLTGELDAPRVEGTLGLSTGTLNLDPILDLAGNSAYATKQRFAVTDAPTSDRCRAA